MRALPRPARLIVFCLSPVALGTEIFGTLRRERVALAKFFASLSIVLPSTSLLSLFSIPANPAAEPRLSKLIVPHPPGLRVGDRSRDGGAGRERKVCAKGDESCRTALKWSLVFPLPQPPASRVAGESAGQLSVFNWRQGARLE